MTPVKPIGRPPETEPPLRKEAPKPISRARGIDEDFVKAELEKARQFTDEAKRGKKSKKKESVAPEKAKEMMAATLSDPHAGKEITRLVGGSDGVPEDPRAAAVLARYANAPDVLRNDPHWNLMVGDELRNTLRADMPGMEQNKIGRALRTIYTDIARIEGVDMNNATIRGSKDPDVQQKVRFVELAGNTLLPEAGQVMMPDVEGFVTPEFTLVEDSSEIDSLPQDLKKELEGIQLVLQEDPLATGDARFIQDQIKSLRNLAKKGEAYASEARPYLLKLEKHLTDLQVSKRELFGRGDVTALEAEVARHQQELRDAYRRLDSHFSQSGGGSEQSLSQIENRELANLMDGAINSALTSSELEAIQDSLASLRSRTVPDLRDPQKIKSPLGDDDRAVADAASEFIAVKKKLAQFSESVIGRKELTDAEQRYFFRHLTYTPDQVDWIFTEMSTLQDLKNHGRGILQELKIGGNQKFTIKDWEAFEKKAERHFNVMFEEVQRNPSGAWDEWFTMFYHRPAYQTFMARLSMLKGELFETYSKTPDALQPHAVVDGKTITLRTLVDNFYEKMRASYDFQEYCHNAFYILTTRGDLKSLAGYANRLRSDMIDLVFTDPKVQAAYHYFEQILRHELGWNQWRVDGTWFQFMKDPKSGKWVEKITDRVERLMREHFPETKEDWDIQRAMSIARGSLFGVTSVGLDLMGEADAPMAGVRWSGYFGERILYAWNTTRHFFYRWWPSKAERYMPLLYNKMYRSPVRGLSWDPKLLDDWHEKHHSDRLTNLRQYKGGVLPFIQQNNWLKVSGSEGRGGWRKRASIERIFSHLPLKPDEFHNFNYAKFTVDQLKDTRRDIEKTGLNYLYFWADTLDRELRPPEKRPPEVTKEQWAQKWQLVKDAQLTLGDVYLDILHKDPLFFLTRDSTLWDQSRFNPDPKTRKTPITFKDTIRGKAIKKLVDEDKVLGSEWNNLVNSIRDPIAGIESEGLVSAQANVNALRDRLDRMEEDLMKATEVMVRFNKMRWDTDVTSALAERIGPERTQLAKAYHEAIVTVVTAGKEHPLNEKEDVKQEHLKYRTEMTWERTLDKKSGKPKTFIDTPEKVTFLEEFMKREVPYTVGTVTKNWDAVSEAGGEAGGGQGVQARALDDALKMADGVVGPSLYFNYKLDDLVDAKGDWAEIDKYLKAAREAITYVHGQGGEYDKFSHDVNELMLRNFQKAWWARLPVGIGNASSVLMPALTSWNKENQLWASNSQKIVQNPLQLAFDEQKIYARLRHLIDVNLLTPQQGELLMKELGGTAGAATYDAIRSYLPWVAALGIFAGFAKGRSDQEEK